MSGLKFKNIEELMDKLNNEYKVLLDVIDNVILVIDNEMKILFVNRKGRKLIGENVLMQPCKALKMDNCSTEKCCIMRYLHGLQPLDNLHKDGSVEKVTVSRFYDNQNNPQGFIIVATDITELSNMKKELLIGEEIYKLALKQANTTLWQYDVLNHTIEQLFCPDEVALGILDINKTYYNIPESLVEAKIISQEDGLRVRKLCQEIEKGRPETSIELKMKRGDGEERWISLKCSTNFDEQGRAVKSIGIGKDITDFVELKSKYEIEREYREALGKDALSYIEVNLTMNEVIDWKIAKNNFIDFYDGKNYEKSILKLSENSIPSEYGKALRELNRQNLLNNYRDGKRKLDLEYQFYNKFKDNYNFIQITLYLIEFNKDIYACGYIKDINENKVHDLVLKKKIELDPLTGLYNREAIEIKTNEIIQNFPENNHAIMILDIDNFKQVNDNFGHLYGDAFLCEISRKIKSKFRNDDLVARLGGDEYLVLMKNISNSELAIDKANDLCKLIEGAYGTGGTKVKVTVSVGVVLYPNHGKTFDELYHHGDQALYKIKKNNKNGVCLYDESLEISDGQLDKVNNIVDRATKKFSDNVGEYIFRILYKCQDLNETITAVLELLGMHYYMSQNLIIVRDLDIGKYKVNNYWSSKNEDLTKVIDVTYHDYWPEYVRQFDDEGILWVNDIKASDVSPAIKTLYANSKTRMVISGLIKNGDDIIGIISMEHEKPYAYKAEEKEMLLTSIAIISTFLVKKYQEKEKNQYLNAIQMILDFQENGIYVIDPNTYKLVYYNHKIKHIFNQVKVGDYCYKSFRGYDEPCADCPIKDMKDSDLSYTKLIYNCNISAQLETTVKRVRWINGQDVAAVTSIDITKYYNEK